MSRSFGFSRHLLAESDDEYLKIMYAKTLLMMVKIEYDSEFTFGRLAFIQCILNQFDIKKTLPELLEDVMCSSANLVTDILDIFVESENSITLLVNRMVVANLFGIVSDIMLKLVLDIDLCLDCDKEDIIFISNVSRCILHQRIDYSFNEKTLNDWCWWSDLLLVYSSVEVKRLFDSYRCIQVTDIS